MAFLFASPSYLRIQVPEYEEEVGPIAYKSEFDEMTKLMNGSELIYRKAAANIQNLSKCLEIGTGLIHISCHGVLGSILKDKMG